MLWVAGVPIKKPKIKCKACNKHYIPSEQIRTMCGYFETENPFCKWCQKLPTEELNEMLKKIIITNMTTKIPNCYKCGKKGESMYKSWGIKFEGLEHAGANGLALICKECKEQADKDLKK